MDYSSKNTNWALSAKGNMWRRVNGVALIVGKRKDGRWWARRGDVFLAGSFPSMDAAKRACEQGTSGDTDSPDFDLWDEE